jgi:hypothetical protein
MIDLAYHHDKRLPGVDIDLECLIRIRAGSTVSNPVGADVVRIEALQISRNEEEPGAGARRIRIDRHALRRTGGVRERVRFVKVRILIINIYRARRSPRTRLRNAAAEQPISLRRIASVDASRYYDGCACWRR